MYWAQTTNDWPTSVNDSTTQLHTNAQIETGHSLNWPESAPTWRDSYRSFGRKPAAKLAGFPCSSGLVLVDHKHEDQGPLQMSLFDDQYLAEISHPNYPGECLIVCRIPALAEHRAAKRDAWLTATEAMLANITTDTRGNKPYTAA